MVYPACSQTAFLALYMHTKKPDLAIAAVLFDTGRLQNPGGAKSSSCAVGTSQNIPKMDAPVKTDVKESVVEPPKPNETSSNTAPPSIPSGSVVRAPASSGCLSWLTDIVTAAVDAYSKELKESPLRTKAITSCAIAMLGELIGTQMKPRRRDGSRGQPPR